MSKAGIQSNRGDGYQTLIAFGWALSVLSDPDYEWLEVDSVTWSVDDVVVGKADGTKICCQCKKNHPEFKAWSITDLSDELDKASRVLVSDPTAMVRFYSRSPFGELAALREFSTNYAEEASYKAGLGSAHKTTDAKLNELLKRQAVRPSTYEFLCRTEFLPSDELDRQQTLLFERLRGLVSNPKAAFDALWTRLDHLGMRHNGTAQSAATQHRLTKDDLKTLLTHAGAMLTPPMSIVDVRAAFRSTSAIGRAWRRDIGNERLPNPVVNELIAAIEAKNRSILLTGLPGSGKTCVMLALQEALEQRAATQSDLQPLFIQSREFADMDTVQERQAQGLSDHWVQQVARTAEEAHAVVVIDSLDVLSIAREHSVLTYFLAQIDRLLLIPNVTVVTACRDFDRHYDRRIASRTWDKELTCRPLDWDREIAPLLERLGIDASFTDSATRELIRNPRELALFVELAKREGSFDVVTSQELATRYLTTIIQENSALGDAAMRAIEAIAAEMLMSRCLAVPMQRFPASQDIQRALLSHDVLHKTQDGKLAFGHQTLLDVLVISGAMRRGVTLNEFICELPPVPFVRPSIRSFVAQLATGDRREYRKQLRAVLSGNNAFHIRRLVAETFSEQAPHDDDWPLLRDLRSQHRDVFQVIYTQAVRVEWHFFWLKHLVPALNRDRDVASLTMHVHRVSQWKNEDAESVLAFWGEVLASDWSDKTQIGVQLDFALSDMDPKHSALLAPLLVSLLNLQSEEHSFRGRALARCVQSGALDDAVLWRYVAGEVTDEDVHQLHFGKNLRCEPHEFGNSDNAFLLHRMQQSVELLNLAVESIERWSAIKRSRYGESITSYWVGFLRETSYNDAHSQTDFRHVDSARILLDAVEAAIVHHASNQSDWWQSNRDRLCFNAEGALRYFAIMGCIEEPLGNLDVIARLLSDKALLESVLSYEVGTLISAAYLYLDPPTQESVQDTVLALHQDYASDATSRIWMLRAQTQLILAIPCHLRSMAAQTVLMEFERNEWPLGRQPDIYVSGGTVGSPLSFEVFLDASDSAVLRLLAHYNGFARSHSDDFMSGGEQQVGWQLREAASRNPVRFLSLLAKHWPRIADRFCDEIMEGVARYLAHRFGNLQISGSWIPVEEPDAPALAQKILDELDRHPTHWSRNRAASSALQSCAHVVQTTLDAARLVFLAMNFVTSREESSISSDHVDLLTTGINMAKGHVVEALMILANQLNDVEVAWPDLLAPALRQFAMDDHQAIRALMLRRLAYLQSHHRELGWELFTLVMENDAPGLWAMAEPCLYYAYHRQFEIVGPELARLSREGADEDLKTWGRISALAALSKKIDLSIFLADLSSQGSAEAWRGAASVWTHPENMQQHREQCMAGLAAGMNQEGPYAVAVAHKLRSVFRDTSQVAIPTALIQRFFALLEAEEKSARSDVYGFDAWLNAYSSRDPMSALVAFEAYLHYVRKTSHFLYDHDNNLTQILTRLFAQAEEQEESDDGAMLQRVVAAQDELLASGVHAVNDWLKAAERT